MEIWKPYRENETYEISNKGNVRNRRTGRNMRISTNSKGYKTTQLIIDDICRSKRIARLVAETFLDTDKDHTGLDVTYKDGNKSNVRDSNLVWASRKDIINNSYKNGREQTHRMRKVRCIETGEVFKSITECSKVMGISREGVGRSANNPFTKTRDGYHFEFIE